MVFVQKIRHIVDLLYHFPNNVKREQGIQICSVLGIILNILLFVGKLTAGLFLGSVAINSDAINNLSDAGSSLVTLLGVKLSAKKPDSEHPFGHGRIEYISAFSVSVFIIIMGFEFAKESIVKIFSPTELEGDFFWQTMIILSFSVLVKAYMWFYNRRYGKFFGSSSMMATSVDSLSDAVATFAVILSTVITRFADLGYVDGVCGLLVSLFVFNAGYRSVKETLVPLLGQPPKKELIQSIEKIVMSFPGIIGVHDIVVHDYGPGRIMISLHAEVSQDATLSAVHDVIDNAEAELSGRLSCNAVIHCDPVDTKDPTTMKLKEEVLSVLAKISPKISMHDFRVVHGKTHTNLIFDLLIPGEFEIEETTLCKMVRDEILSRHPSHYCYIQIDYDYCN